MRHPRSVVAILCLSAAGFAGIAMREGYTDKAVIPIPGDRPTVGLGSTFKEDGSPVTMKDTITPQRAIRLAVDHISKDEVILKRCFGDAKLYQHEWDAYVRLSHNVGAGAVCRSSIVSKVQNEKYQEACNTILDFKRAAGKDCSLRANKCYGLWLDRLATHELCVGEPE